MRSETLVLGHEEYKGWKLIKYTVKCLLKKKSVVVIPDWLINLEVSNKGLGYTVNDDYTITIFNEEEQ